MLAGQPHVVVRAIDRDVIGPGRDMSARAQTIEVETILREDVITPSLAVDEALAGAPERVGDHLVVTESALDGREVALVCKPRNAWPKMFGYLRLYRDAQVPHALRDESTTE